MSFLFRLRGDDTILISTSTLLHAVNKEQCGFIKCFLALPEHKYKLVRTLNTKTMSSDDFVSIPEVQDFGGIELLQQSKLFLKLKLFSSTNQTTPYAEHVFCGTFDVNDFIYETLNTLSRCKSLRKLLVV